MARWRWRAASHCRASKAHVTRSARAFMQENSAFIVSAVRLPIGSMGGSLSAIPATKLGSLAVKGALDAAKVAPSEVRPPRCHRARCLCGDDRLLGDAPFDSVFIHDALTSRAHPCRSRRSSWATC
jgi:hypothetical protein